MAGNRESVTYLDMLSHYTSVLSKNKLKRVLKKWERYESVSEWGYSWVGGYILEMTDGNLWHMHGWLTNDAPWMNQAWVYADPLDLGDASLDELPWEDYLVRVER